MEITSMQANCGKNSFNGQLFRLFKIDYDCIGPGIWIDFVNFFDDKLQCPLVTFTPF